MPTKSERRDLYSGSEFTFKDIVFDGKLGGRSGLQSYLKSRSSQLTRELKSAGNNKQQKDRILIAIKAMTDGIKIIEKMSGEAGTAK